MYGRATAAERGCAGEMNEAKRQECAHRKKRRGSIQNGGDIKAGSVQVDDLDVTLAFADLALELFEELQGALGAGDDSLDFFPLGGRLVERSAETLAQVPAGEAEDLANLACDAIGVGRGESDGRGGGRGRAGEESGRRRKRELELAADVARNGAREIDDDIDDEANSCVRDESTERNKLV